MTKGFHRTGKLVALVEATIPEVIEKFITVIGKHDNNGVVQKVLAFQGCQHFGNSIARGLDSRRVYQEY